MKWKKFTLTTTTEAVDLVSCMFDEIGIEGIEIEDNVPLTESETKPDSTASTEAASQPQPMAESDVQDAILATAGSSEAASDAASDAAAEPDTQSLDEPAADSTAAEADAADNGASSTAA